MSAPVISKHLGVPAAEPRARFADLFAAEWLKTWSLRSTAWTLLGGALAVIAINGGAAYEEYKYWYQPGAVDAAGFIPHGFALLDAFTLNAAMVLVLVSGLVGALAVTGEYGTGQIRTTLAAVPARRSVMAAKLSVVAVVLAGFGALVAAASFFLTQVILSWRHAGVPIGYPGALRVVLASALLAPVAALIGLALGTVIRHSAAAVTSGVVVLLVVPITLTDSHRWTAVVQHAMPFRAWLRLVDVNYTASGPYPPTAYTWTLTGAWTVYAAWALIAAAVAILTVQHRDQ